MTKKARIIVSTLALAVLIAPALAQTPPPANPGPKADVTPPKLDPKACADSRRATVGATDTPHNSAAQAESPGETLARTDGVICPPPDIDPAIRAPAPGGGVTPVIPPTGSEDPAVRAK